MSFRVTCKTCGRRLRVPDKWIGRKVMCPECEHVVPISAPENVAPAPARSASLPHHLAEDLTAGLSDTSAPSNRLAFIALILATLSVMLLCIPFVGYVAVPLSGVGVLLSLCGLILTAVRRDRAVVPLLASTAASLFALGLALFPHLRP